MRWLDATPRRGGAEGPRNLHLACSKHIESSPPTEGDSFPRTRAQNAWGLCCYDKGAYLADLSDPVIEVITGHVPRKTSPIRL